MTSWEVGNQTKPLLLNSFPKRLSRVVLLSLAFFCLELMVLLPVSKWGSHSTKWGSRYMEKNLPGWKGLRARYKNEVMPNLFWWRACAGGALLSPGPHSSTLDIPES